MVCSYLCRYLDFVCFSLAQPAQINILNQYSAITGANAPAAAPAYDDDGNQLSGSSGAASGQTFIWDGENRLTTVKDSNGNVLVTSAYDHASRRIRRATSATTTLYVYDGWNCVAEYQASNTQLTTIILTKTYIWGSLVRGGVAVHCGSVGLELALSWLGDCPTVANAALRAARIRLKPSSVWAFDHSA
jgi:hypothetical protein